MESLLLLLLSLLLLLIITTTTTVAAKKRRPSSRRPPVRRLQYELRSVVRDGVCLSLPSATAASSIDSNATSVRLGPVPGNLHEWHFSFSGVAGSPYEGGIYHGRFILPNDYPIRAPRVQLLTPNGRFKCGQDICLSASAYHQESWSTHWSLHKLVLALRMHMVTRATEIGGIERSPTLRRALAAESRRFRCPRCSTDHAELVASNALADLWVPPPLGAAGEKEEEEKAAVVIKEEEEEEEEEEQQKKDTVKECSEELMECSEENCLVEREAADCSSNNDDNDGEGSDNEDPIIKFGHDRQQ
jgi:ubiquitin-protein ligase